MTGEARDKSQTEQPRFLWAIGEVEKHLSGWAAQLALSGTLNAEERASTMFNLMAKAACVAGAAQRFDFTRSIPGLAGSGAEASAHEVLTESIQNLSDPVIRGIYADIYGITLDGEDV